MIVVETSGKKCIKRIGPQTSKMVNNDARMERLTDSISDMLNGSGMSVFEALGVLEAVKLQIFKSTMPELAKLAKCVQPMPKNGKIRMKDFNTD